MLRRAPAPVLALLACSSVAFVGGCDKKGTATPDEVVTPEPEPEPEPPKPSNEPSQTWEPLWATASGKPTANLVGVRDGRVYALAGEYVDNGEPSTHLVAFAEDSGAVQWTFANKTMLTVDGANETLVGLTASEKPLYVAIKTGKKAKPKKGETDTITPFEGPTAASGCTAEGVKIGCGEWSVEEGGTIADVQSFEDMVCYAVATAREVRCRSTSTGDLGFAITVPAVEGVKDPEATNFQFGFANGKLFISNYDGAVMAFGRAGGGDDAVRGEEPAAEGEDAAAEG